jgi:hypothetical protein
MGRTAGQRVPGKRFDVGTPPFERRIVIDQSSVDALVPLIAGFLLTTVLGGLLGSFFQRRAWAHQHAVQLREQGREQAIRVFEEVSRLMDKRLYRLRLLYWSLALGRPDDQQSDMPDDQMNGYRQVLYDWNDNINRNLALLQQYFGDQVRNQFDNVIGAEFVMLGANVESSWRDRVGSSGAPTEIDDQLEDLGDLVYRYNVELIQAIRSRFS